ncbi:MAG TPA: hypothetical protein VFS67_02490 [Polyangiaceae bacterium]|nr:hypothetical protein [Polyangiaceae bacterium]
MPSRTDAIWWPLIGFVVFAASALRLWLAVTDHSIYWPDEIYQSLEQAHRLAFGNGFIPWEFRDGARSWLLPGLIAGVWRVAAALGVHSSLTLVELARGLTVLGSAASLWLSARLCARLSSPRAGFIAVLVLAVLPASVVFGYRTLSESLSAPLVVLAALALLDGIPRRTCAAAVCIALATLLRYQNALFGLVFLLWLGGERRRRDVILYFATGVATLLAGGLLDWATWGRPFHSLIAYVDFNLLRGGASTFGVEPFWYYAKTLWDGTGPAVLIFGALAVLGGMRIPGLGMAVLSSLLAHSVIPHKELRFIVPALPLACVLVGLGADYLLHRAGRYARWCWVGLGASTLATALALPHLDYRHMGQYLDTPRGSRSVWHSDQEANLLLASAGEKPDLCGLGVLGLRPAFTGGYTYFHRAEPLIYGHHLCGAEPTVNYVIVPYYLADQLLPEGYSSVEDRGWLGLFRRPGGCEPPSGFDTSLDGAHDMGLHRPFVEQGSDGSIYFDLLRHSGNFAQGWGMGEQIDCKPARWAVGHRSVIQFRAAASDQPYVLRARMRAYDTGATQELRLSLNGKSLFEGPVPVSSWILAADVPALQRGNNELVFEPAQVGTPGGDDDRELSILLESLDLTPLVRDFDIEVGTDLDSDHLLAGFSPPEVEDKTAFVWNDGPFSVFSGRLDTPAHAHLLTFTAQAIAEPGTTARVSVNGKPLGKLQIEPVWSRSTLLVPPEFLKLGTNQVRLDYGATIAPATLHAGSTDQRQLAARFRRFTLGPVPEQEVLDLGTNDARPGLLDGWSNDELEGERTVVWNHGHRSRLRVWLSGQHDAHLRIEARAYPPALPLSVEVRLNDNVAGAFQPSAEWGVYDVPLLARFFGEGASVIEFRYDRVAKPSEHEPGSHDERELAVRWDRITIVR